MPGGTSVDQQPKASKKAHKGGGRKATHKPKAQRGGDLTLWWLFGGSYKQQLTLGAMTHHTTSMQTVGNALITHAVLAHRF